MKKTKFNPSLATELTSGEVAAQSCVAPSAIRFYESKGLIAGRRTIGGRRRYPREVLKRVAIIKASQSVGISLSAVREILTSLPQDRFAAAEDWSALLRRWQAQLDERLAHFASLRDELDYCSGCGCLSLESCPLAAPADPGGAKARMRADDF